MQQDNPDIAPKASLPEGFVEHPLRAAALGEIHARPFLVMRTPRLVLHHAFMTGPAAAAAARDDLAERCRRLGVTPPEADARHHVVAIAPGRLRWETHGEFTTYTFDVSWELARERPLSLTRILGDDFLPPGPLIVAARLDLVDDPRPIEELLDGLDPGSIAVSNLRDGRAFAATDFLPDEDGITGIVVVDRGLQPQETGPLIQRLIEIETYRTLALLGLPEARRLQPVIARVEERLGELTEAIGETTRLEAGRQMLADLTALAAEIEANAVGSAYRFGASRAYADIVRQRFQSVREGPLEGYTRWSSFLERRLAPAMNTCENVERRLNDLAQRLARAANLLRTRIEVELEEQNRMLLSSMNRRARMQLRLQQTVEGLSVAAISYYVVGLIGYLAKGTDAFGWRLDSTAITALAVVPAMLLIWFLVRRIRARHAGGED